MRWVRDMALVIGLAAVGLGATSVQQEERSRDALVQTAIDQKRRIEQVVGYRAAAKSGDLNPRGWPVTIDPSWFDDAPPINPLLDADRPWIEIASAADAGLLNPPIRVAIDPTMAMFWYNPYQGVVRARVPVMVNDEIATQTYNQVNGATLGSIFDHETPIEPPKPRADAAPGASPPSAEAPDDRPLAGPPQRPNREPTMVRAYRAKTKSHASH